MYCTACAEGLAVYSNNRFVGCIQRFSNACVFFSFSRASDFCSPANCPSNFSAIPLRLSDAVGRLLRLLRAASVDEKSIPTAVNFLSSAINLVVVASNPQQIEDTILPARRVDHIFTYVLKKDRNHRHNQFPHVPNCVCASCGIDGRAAVYSRSFSLCVLAMAKKSRRSGARCCFLLSSLLSPVLSTCDATFQKTKMTTRAITSFGQCTLLYYRRVQSASNSSRDSDNGIMRFGAWKFFSCILSLVLSGVAALDRSQLDT